MCTCRMQSANRKNGLENGDDGRVRLVGGCELKEVYLVSRLRKSEFSSVYLIFQSKPGT